MCIVFYSYIIDTTKTLTVKRVPILWLGYLFRQSLILLHLHFLLQFGWYYQKNWTLNCKLKKMLNNQHLAIVPTTSAEFLHLFENYEKNPPLWSTFFIIISQDDTVKVIQFRIKPYMPISSCRMCHRMSMKKKNTSLCRRYFGKLSMYRYFFLSRVFTKHILCSFLAR